MPSGRRGLVINSAWCLLGAWLCAGALMAQETPRRPAAVSTRTKQPSRERAAAPVYGPPKQTTRQVAAGARPTGTNKFQQFAPQPRRPQPTWGQLSEEQEAALELVLQSWEKHSSEVSTLECTFVTWKYDHVFGKGNKPSRVCRGVIKYAAPDKGHYHITEEAVDPSADPPDFVKKEGEHWVCDGNAVYEFDQQNKQLIERRLPDELKGKAISNSPLPFVFGTTAERMRQRYWLKLVTPRELVGKEIWLQVEPIYAEDRANYQHATVILGETKMLPKAVSLALPNGNHTNYVFDVPSVNNTLKRFFGAFKVPATPAGWKRIVEDPPAQERQAAAPPSDVRVLRVSPGKNRK